MLMIAVSASKLLPRSGNFFQVTSKIRYFLARSCKARHFLARSCKTRHFLARSSKIPARIMPGFQVTSKIRQFLPSYFQDQIFSCKDLQDQTFSCKIFQDTCKNNALSSKILEVKSDRFLQKMYGSSTGVSPFANVIGCNLRLIAERTLKHGPWTI